MVRASSDRERVSVRTLFVPATEPSLVQVVMSRLPSHFVTVSAGASMGALLVIGLPVRSKRSSLVCSAEPLKEDTLVMTISSPLCLTVERSFICAIIPTFLLRDGLNSHFPSNFTWAAACNATTKATPRNTRIAFMLTTPLHWPSRGSRLEPSVRERLIDAPREYGHQMTAYANRQPDGDLDNRLAVDVGPLAGSGRESQNPKAASGDANPPSPILHEEL